MLRLLTLGTLAIEADGAPLTGAAAQPKRLKLLALLDRAGDRGATRDQLVEHLWADGGSDRGRGSLNTAVNALRQHLGADALITAGEQVRLNPDVVASDARDFERACRDRRLDDAVALYGGPFLDGHDRRESRRFEEWVSVERERLDARYRGALETLAGDAARRGDHAGAVAWWDRLVARDPLDSRAVIELVHALLRQGDRARALRVAGIHDQLLKQDEREPTPAWVGVAGRLRAGRLEPPAIPGLDAPSRPRHAPPGESAGPAAPAEPPAAVGAAEPRPFDPDHDRTAAELPGGRRPRHVVLWTMAVGAAVVVLVLGRAVRIGAYGRPPTAPTADPHRVAVLYFDDATHGAGLGAAAGGLTEGVIENLQRVPALRVIAPEGVRPFRSRAVSPDSIARRLQVGILVSGTVDTAAGALRATVRLLDGRTAELLATDTLTRPLAEPATLQRDMAADLASAVRRRLGEQISLREQDDATSSAEARALVRRARRIERDELANDYSIRAADLVAAYERADSLLAAAERLDPRWYVPVTQRAWLAEDRAVRAWLSGGSWPPPADERRQIPGRRLSADGWRQVGLAHAERALRLSPGVPDGLEVRGQLRFGLWQWSRTGAADSLLDAAIADLQAAVDARPELASARTALTLAYQKAGNFGLARLAAERALETYLGPAAPSVVGDLLFIALNEERYADAGRICAQGQRRFPDSPELRGCEATVLGWSGFRPADAARAWRVVDSVEAVEPAEVTKLAWAQRRMFVAAILARAGLADSARAVLRTARAATGTAPWLDANEAYVRLRLGEPAAAIALLRRYIAENPAQRRSTAASPWFRDLRADPEFSRLVRPQG
jgi:DNA-binding SARP family transcriptional activator/TolB-like protein